MTPLRGIQALHRLAAMLDPVRRRLYDHVAAQPEPVGRDSAAAAVGISRRLAAFHLDKLADAGLLTTSFRRLTGRSGPGAGRPAKLYARAEDEVTVSVPPRDYELAARLFADAVAALGDDGRQAAEAAGRRMGRALAAPDGRQPEEWPARLSGLLTAIGYQPYDDPDGADVLRLRNCPFHRVAQEHRQLVCTVNLEMLRGMLAEIAPDSSAELEPLPGQCCVAVRA